MSNYNDVIIYGYGDIGTCLLNYIIDIETDIKFANYSGKIKYFATTSDCRESLRDEIRGIKIKSIAELVDYHETALVVIATQEKHHADIAKKLDEYNFANRLFVLHEDYCEIREKYENHKNALNNRIGQYHLNHKIKLEHLRKKVENRDRIKVYFMVHDSAVFGASSIYFSMEKSTLFDPYIYVVSRRDVNYRDFLEDVYRDVTFFEQRGFKVICGYDSDGTPKDLHNLEIDILFFDLPKLHGMAKSFYNRLEHLNWEYLTCYIPYGLNMVDSFYYHYHLEAIRESWRYFADCKSDYKRCLADSDFNGFNTVFCGYPKFDDYNIQEGRFIPSKIDNGKPIVIYAPHHSLGVSNNFATFDLYWKTIFEFVKRHKEINYVFKPHPLLKYQIAARSKSGNISITIDDYNKYLDDWNNLENGIVYETGEYIELFKRSKCMITDCGSFIGEYLPSTHPCIYILNPRKKNQLDAYTSVGRNILETYYIVEDRHNLESTMNQIILKDEDPKYEERVACLNREFGEVGQSGQRICDYIEKELRS